MNINRKNYEVFFIDYFDGKLTAKQVADLMYFISQNPDLAEEFNSFEELTLPLSEIKFHDKNSLKNISQKTLFISDDNFDTYCIAYLEDDLNLTERTSFEKYLENNPLKQNNYKIFAQTKLKPETSIVYDQKAGLKRFVITGNYKRIIFTGFSAAASISIIFFLFFIYSKTSEIKIKYAVRDTTSYNDIIDTVKNQTQKIQQVEPIKQNQKMVQTIIKNNLIIADNNINMENDSSIQEKNNNKQKITYNKIVPLENKKFIALEVEPPVHNSIKIDYSIYKKNKKKENPQTIAQFLKTKLQNAVKGDNSDPKHKFGFVDVADALVRGVNKITGKKMKLQKTYDSKGEVETLAFYSENLQVYKGAKK